MIKYKQWLINIQQVPYLMECKNFINKALLKRKLGRSSEYHKKWYSVGSKNLVLSPVSQLKEINGESLTICGKAMKLHIKPSTTGLKNNRVSQIDVNIADLQQALLSGQISGINTNGILKIG